MVEIHFLGPIKKEKLYAKLDNVKELKAFLQKDESLRLWLGLCAISVNEKIVSELDTPLKDGDCICLLPPVSGG